MMIALLTPFLAIAKSAQGQSVQGQDPADSATLQGSVRDSRGRPVAAATVHLQTGAGTQNLTTRTDSEGSYRFSSLRAGVYSLRAEMAGYSDVTSSPCILALNQVKRIDLTLRSAQISSHQNGSPGTSGAERPQFFDEPQFTVAGVTEAMNPGGHGSDTILRTTEALAKETAALGVSVPNNDSDRLRMGSAASPSTGAEEPLRKAAESEPEIFDVNRRLGKLLFDEGKAGEALPYLERAAQLNPSDYENAYELAISYADVGKNERARTEARTLLAQEKSGQEQAELHQLLGSVEEKLGNPLESVREYQRAAELKPSEANVFDWGAELLIHRAFEPAIEVFTDGNHLFPRSARMLAGLGVAWYARGSYDVAVQRLCEASDLNPNNPDPYLLLGKMQSVETTQSECMVDRLARFVRLEPENALANYYYAISLSRPEGSEDASHLAPAECLLQKAVRLDPKLAGAYLQLGVLYSRLGESSKAISAYQEAIEANPGLEQAHYRLAQAYNRNGEKSKAQAELQLYEQSAKKSAAEVERERREIQQFVYTLREPASAPQAH